MTASVLNQDPNTFCLDLATMIPGQVCGVYKAGGRGPRSLGLIAGGEILGLAVIQNGYTRTSVLKEIAFVSVCVRACVRARARACVCVCVCVCPYVCLTVSEYIETGSALLFPHLYDGKTAVFISVSTLQICHAHSPVFSKDTPNKHPCSNSEADNDHSIV